VKFTYQSSVTGQQKELPDDLVAAARQHLIDEGFNPYWDRGDLQECLLEFRYEGERCLLNQLVPLFNYVAQTGQLWPEDDPL
jgi:hypothetical protein